MSYTTNSSWTHAICDACWRRRNPDRHPVRAVLGAEELRCCFCGDWTETGIFVRHAPEELRCRGHHDR